MMQVKIFYFILLTFSKNKKLIKIHYKSTEKNFFPKPKKSIKPIMLRKKKIILSRNEILREKFIRIAKSYIGVPYSQKYLNKENPLFYSPIFLDCCGLVRKCINDLRDELGIKLGNGNQSYQYDVLPEEITFDKMKQGDLIFYSGKYYKEKKVKLSK